MLRWDWPDPCLLLLQEADDPVIPAEAVNTHWLNSRDGSWCCDGCDWTGDTIEAFWDAHNVRTHDDNIPF